MADAANGSIEVVSADPVARRRALWLVTSATLLGAGVIFWLLPWARDALAQAVQDGRLGKGAVCKSALLGFMLLALPVGGFGVYAYRFGRRVEREQRFPPAGVSVIRDTRVLHGRAAGLLGRAQAINGALLVVLAIALFGLCAYGFMMFGAVLGAK